jgi:hypothetical protein
MVGTCGGGSCSPYGSQEANRERKGMGFSISLLRIILNIPLKDNPVT